jgi:hypothetical protein
LRIMVASSTSSPASSVLPPLPPGETRSDKLPLPRRFILPEQLQFRCSERS